MNSFNYKKFVFLGALIAFNAYTMESSDKPTWRKLPLDLQKLIAFNVITSSSTPAEFFNNLLNIKIVSKFSDFYKILQVLKNEFESTKNNSPTKFFLNQTLIHAIKNESVPISKALIFLGANAKVWDPGTQRPIIDYHWNKHSLTYRLFHKRKKSGIEQLLINNGAVENVPYDFADYKLLDAASNGDLETVKNLIRGGANVNKELTFIRKFETPLLNAVLGGNLEIVKELIFAGANVNIRYFQELTALTMAAIDGHLEMVKELISAGADIDAKIIVENTWIIRILKRWGYLIGARDNIDGATILNLIATTGNLEIINELIKANADINSKDRNGDTVLAIAACSGQLEVVKALINAGADIDKNAIEFSRLNGDFNIADYLENLLENR